MPTDLDVADKTDRRIAGVMAPPPLLPAGVLVVAEALRWWHPLPLPTASGWRWTMAAGVGLSAVALAASAVLVLRRARTPVEPWKPTRAIVTTGPYRWSRNPIYVAFLGVQLAYGWARGDAWPMLLLPITIGLLTWGVILREERYLAERFGPSYAAYRAQVRRWL